MNCSDKSIYYTSTVNNSYVLRFGTIANMNLEVAEGRNDNHIHDGETSSNFILGLQTINYDFPRVLGLTAQHNIYIYMPKNY